MMLKSTTVKKFESGKSIDNITYEDRVAEGLFVAVILFALGVITGIFIAFFITRGVC